MFDKNSFVKNCLAALRDDDPAASVSKLMEQALRDRTGLAAGLGDDSGALVDFLYRSEQLTIANMHTVPGSVSPVHNHRMWAVIGMYQGQEDNHLYRRNGDTIEQTQIKSLRPGDIFVMDPDLIHAISNPLTEKNGALHVYGGDLQNRPGRSLWEPDSLRELPYEFDRLMAFTERMNQSL